VRLKEHGLELIEVADNGRGVAAGNQEALALKYHTSKIANFGDLEVGGGGVRRRGITVVKGAQQQQQQQQQQQHQLLMVWLLRYAHTLCAFNSLRALA
jgi:hypothetical protein